MQKTRIFIVDDHQMLIDGLKALLKSEQDIEIAGESTNARKALDELAVIQPEIVLSDISMPDMDGIEFTRNVKKQYPHIRILALSMFNDRSMITEMIDAGASGYILKNTGKDELKQAITKIASGNFYFSDEVSGEILKAITDKQQNKDQEPVVNLTSREIEIIQLIAQELSNAEIASQLFISERTVETHRKNIFRKTNTKSVVGLIKYAIEQKIV
jgi:DNA-binding NarL/FixJ family response regulator